MAARSRIKSLHFVFDGLVGAHFYVNVSEDDVEKVRDSVLNSTEEAYVSTKTQKKSIRDYVIDEAISYMRDPNGKGSDNNIFSPKIRGKTIEGVNGSIVQSYIVWSLSVTNLKDYSTVTLCPTRENISIREVDDSKAISVMEESYQRGRTYLPPMPTYATGSEVLRDTIEHLIISTFNG